MTTATFIIIMLVVAFIAIIINGIEDYSNDREAMSFREAMDLVELPVVTFHQGKERFNFLLDTGSNHSHISKQVSHKLKGELLTGTENINGVGGEVSISNAINTTLQYKDSSYDVTLLIGEHLDATFNTIKESSGVIVHGILGSAFFNEHKYILDFESLIAYSKK